MRPGRGPRPSSRRMRSGRGGWAAARRMRRGGGVGGGGGGGGGVGGGGRGGGGGGGGAGGGLGRGRGWGAAGRRLRSAGGRCVPTGPGTQGHGRPPACARPTPGPAGRGPAERSRSGRVWWAGPALTLAA